MSKKIESWSAMSSLKNELLTTLDSFKNGQKSIDWAMIWDDSDLCDLSLDAIESFIDNLAVEEALDEEQRVQLVGRLTIARVHLFDAFNKDLAKQFINAGHHIDQILREALTDHILSAVNDRFETYEKNEDKISSQQFMSDEELDYYRPVFMAIAIMTLLSVDQEAEYEE